MRIVFFIIILMKAAAIFKTFPLFFISHQGPMALFEQNSPHLDKLKKIDSIIQPFKKDIKAVIFISAHYGSNGKTLVLGKENLETIHDHGFSECYDYRYSPKGHPEVAKEIVGELTKAGVKAELSKDWGADHAVWSIMPVFYPDPKDLKIVVISVDIGSGEENIANVGRVVGQFRSKNCLVISSGTMTHNIRVAFTGLNSQTQPLIKQIREFDDWSCGVINNNQGKKRTQEINKFRQQKNFRAAHPSDEHWLPLIFSIGAAENTNVTDQVWKYEDLPGMRTHAFMFYNKEDKEDL